MKATLCSLQDTDGGHWSKILNPAGNNTALYGPAIAHPHWIPLIFNCTGELSAEEGRMSSAEEAHKGGKLSEDEDAALSAPASLQETSSTVPWEHRAAGMAAVSSCSSWLSSTPAGAEGSQRAHFSRCQTTSRLVLKNGLRKVR